MKDFNELRKTNDDKTLKSSIMDFKELQESSQPIFESETIEHLTEDERKQAEEIYIRLRQYLTEHEIKEIDEGIIGSIVGGAAGFLAGPALGKAVAHALGIEKGILYDMLTSRLVVAALGAALGKKI